jgi:hypothetical protein
MEVSSRTVGIMGKGIGVALNVVPWWGGTAERFRQRWGAEYARSLAEAAAFLDRAADTLRRNAQGQRDASGIVRQQHRSLWERFKEHFNRVVEGIKRIYEAIPWEFKQIVAALRFAVETIVPMIKIVAKLAGPLAVIGAITALVDLFQTEYAGAFKVMETLIDVVAAIAAGAGIVALVAVSAKVVLVAGAIAVVGGGIALIADWGMQYWDKGGGRELWRSTRPALRRGFEMWRDSQVRTLPGIGRDLIDRTWDTPRPVPRPKVIDPLLPGLAPDAPRFATTAPRPGPSVLEQVQFASPGVSIGGRLVHCDLLGTAGGTRVVTV